MTQALVPRHPQRARGLAGLAVLLGLLAACVAGPTAGLPAVTTVPMASGTAAVLLAATRAPSSTPVPTAPPTVTATPTPRPRPRLILPADGATLTPAEQAALQARLDNPPAEWGYDPAVTDFQVTLGENGHLYLTLLAKPTTPDADPQLLGRIIVLESLTGQVIAIADLAAAQAAAQKSGLTPVSYIWVDYEGRVAGADDNGQPVVILDLTTKAWGPDVPPTPEPTATPETVSAEIATIQKAIETWVAGKYEVIGIRVSWDGKDTPRLLNLIQDPGQIFDCTEYSDIKPFCMTQAQGVIIGHTLTPSKDAVIVYIGFSSGFAKPGDNNFVLPFKIGPIERSTAFFETGFNQAGISPGGGQLLSIAEWDAVLGKLAHHAVDVTLDLGYPDRPESDITDRIRYFEALYDESGAVVAFLNQQLPPELQGKYIFKTPPRADWVDKVINSTTPLFEDLPTPSGIFIEKLPA